MRLGLPENQPVWFRTLLACFALVMGLGFLAGGALGGLATLRWLNQKYLGLWPDTVVMDDLSQPGALAFLIVVGGGGSLAGFALVWGGARELRACYLIVHRWLAEWTNR
jgi:hypothetical protein